MKYLLYRSSPIGCQRGLEHRVARGASLEIEVSRNTKLALQDNQIRPRTDGTFQVGIDLNH